MSQDQPDGIEDDSTDLPDPLKAAERVNAFLSAYGDGLIVAEWLPEYLPPGGQPPLYARDLAALVDVHNQGLVLTAHIGWELAEVTSQRDQARGIATHLEAELAEMTRKYREAWELGETLGARILGQQVGLCVGVFVLSWLTGHAPEALRVRAMYDLGHVEGLDNSMGGADCACGESCWAHTFEGYPSGGACAAGWDAAGKLIAAGWRPGGEQLTREDRAGLAAVYGYELGDAEARRELAKPPADDTETEWGLLWKATGAVQEFESRADAERYVFPGEATVVRRSVGPWEATT